MRGAKVAAAVVGVFLWASWGVADDPDPLWTIEHRAAGGDETTLRLDLPRLRSLLARAPMEGTEGASAPIEIALPMPDGRLLRFAAVESPVLEPALAARFPEIRTYAATALEDRSAIARFDLTPAGFHALVLGPGQTVFVEPASDRELLRYVSAPRQISAESAPPRCAGEDVEDLSLAAPRVPGVPQGGVITRDNERRIYGLLAGATGEFTQARGGTVAAALAAITTTINGVNAIYRRDIGVHLELLAASTSMIFTDPNSDGYSSGDTDCDPAPPPCVPFPSDCLLTENHCHADILVGSDNYDLSIVFDESNKGRAALGSVCGTLKGRGATGGTSVDLAAHEIGHMFAAHHSFNGTTDTCAGERDAGWAMEPGSGSTIMSYAGACGDENIEQGASLQFSQNSFLDMVGYTMIGPGDNCPGYAFTQNSGPVVQSITAGPYYIPAQTPFALSVQAYDPNGDPLTYSWEEEDTGTASPPHDDDGSRPLFRVYPPTTNPERWFPSRVNVLQRHNVPPDTAFCIDGPTCLYGEKLPTTTRTMHFSVMIRDGQDGVSAGYTTLTVDGISGPFKVTQPQDSVATFWTKGTTHIVNWNTARTELTPIDCSNVRILLSIDDGETWPYVLAANTPNDGGEFVTLPFVETTTARIKIEAVGNVFFDVSDAFTIEDLKVTNTNDSGRGSLRSALLDANQWPNGATIPLQITGSGVRTINVLSPLPVMSKEVALDGWDLGGPNYVGPPLLQLNGASCTGFNGIPCDGLVLQGVDSFVNGVIVNRFAGNGIVLRGASSQNHLVQNCYVGTTADGTGDAGNGASGIFIDGSHDNLLWGNVISGNLFGVTIQGTTATGNYLQRNRIGTNAAGTARIWNDDDGVRIVNAPATTVGGPGDGNVLSGNGRVNLVNAFADTLADGVEIQGTSASGTVIQGNYFGLNAAGTSGLDNTDCGVRINGAPNTLIGGTTAAAGNVFGDSSFINYYNAHGIAVQGAGATGTVIQGNYTGTDATGTVKLGTRGAGIYVQTPGVQVGGTAAGARNVIVNARNYAGIYLDTAASGAQIKGNYIGTDVTGSVKLGMPVPGITAFAGNNTIAGNVVAGAAVGIDIHENAASSNIIQGNFIGTNAAGTQDFGNGIGIQILRSGDNLIGGTTAAARNLISGNDQFGLYIPGPPGPAGGNVVQGNYIGTNAAGTAAIPNLIGVSIDETSSITVGGGAPGAGNLISGNQTNGLELAVSSPAVGLVVQGNSIGTNAAENAALPNGRHGIRASVNGAVTILGNVISGNSQHGVEVCCRPTAAILQGNWVGTDRTAALNLGNGGTGIYLEALSSVLGGTAPGEGNVIAFNGAPGTGLSFAGIRVNFGAGYRIRGNRIFGQTGLGVDLGGLGVEPNDSCDTDTGPNNLQNYPALTGANLSGPGIVVTGTLNSTASTTFDVDLYASPSCDGSGFGEGATYLGSTIVSTDAACNGAFTVSLPVSTSGVVTAIATGPSGSSSEFSQCRAVQPSPVAEVTGVTWTSKTALSWSAAAGAADYRLLRGIAADFGNLLDQDPDGCERAVTAGTTTGSVLTEDPLAQPGRLYWYVVVGRNGSFEGPAGAASAGPRLANASGTCP